MLGAYNLQIFIYQRRWDIYCCGFWNKNPDKIYQMGHTNGTEFGYLLYTNRNNKFNVNGIAFRSEAQRKWENIQMHRESYNEINKTVGCRS